MKMPKGRGKKSIRIIKFDKKTIIEHLRSMMTTTIITIVIMPISACTAAIATAFSKRKNVDVIFYFLVEHFKNVVCFSKTFLLDKKK